MVWQTSGGGPSQHRGSTMRCSLNSVEYEIVETAGWGGTPADRLSPEEFWEPCVRFMRIGPAFQGTGDRGNKDRKAYLDKQKIINCGRCPYHRGENVTYRKRNPHDKRRPWRD